MNKNVESLNITETSEEVQKIRNDFMNLWMSNDGNSMSNEELFSELERENGGEELEEARKWEKEEADRREKAWLEQEHQARQREEDAHLQQEYEYGGAHIEHREKSSGGKWFNGVIIIFGVLALGWFVTQGSDSPQVSVNPAPATTPAAGVIPSAGQKTYTNSIGMEFVQIQAGEFDMGSPSSEKDRERDEGPVHRVKISNAFYIGKYEVTQKQWSDVMGSSPSYFKGDNLPVEQVSWNNVQEFIKKLNEKEGGNKYRLPSEAEWEYAARAGTTTRYSFGNDDSIFGSKLGDYAWYYDNSGSKTHTVGQKKPNSWGLYDMHGNVFEWVQDIWIDNYNGAPTDGSAREGSGSPRVFRGGTGHITASNCRSASRAGYVPSVRRDILGFRLVRNV